MATLKETLELKMTSEEYLHNILFHECDLDPGKAKHFKIKTKILESGVAYDMHECVIIVNSDKNLSPVINKRNIIKLLRRIEEPLGNQAEEPYPHILKAIDIEAGFTPDKKSMSVTFHIINNLER